MRSFDFPSATAAVARKRWRMPRKVGVGVVRAARPEIVSHRSRVDGRVVAVAASVVSADFPCEVVGVHGVFDGIRERFDNEVSVIDRTGSRRDAMPRQSMRGVSLRSPSGYNQLLRRVPFCGQGRQAHSRDCLCFVLSSFSGFLSGLCCSVHCRQVWPAASTVTFPASPEAVIGKSWRMENVSHLQRATICLTMRHCRAMQQENCCGRFSGGIMLSWECALNKLEIDLVRENNSTV